MTRAGQVPATVRHEMEGFALNRLQGALLAEAFRLMADDMISPTDLDALSHCGDMVPKVLRKNLSQGIEIVDENGGRHEENNAPAMER